MKRIIAFILTICIFASSFPLTVFADSDTFKIMDKVDARFLTLTSSGNVSNNKKEITLHVYDGVVMADVAQLCEALKLDGTNMLSPEVNERILTLKNHEFNDCVSQEIRVLERGKYKGGFIVRKALWGEHAAVIFVAGQKDFVISSSTIGFCERRLPKSPYVFDNSLWVPLDAFLYLLGCEYYVGNDGVLVVNGCYTTVDDVLNNDFVVRGNTFFNILTDMPIDTNMELESGAARTLQMIDSIFSISLYDYISNLSATVYDMNYGEKLGTLLCCSDEREFTTERDYSNMMRQVGDEYGFFESSLIDAMDKNRNLDYSSMSYADIALLLQNNNTDIINSSNDMMNFCKYAESRGDSMDASDDWFSLVEESVGFLDDLNINEELAFKELTLLGGYLCSVYNALASYENINPQLTQALLEFFKNDGTRYANGTAPDAFYNGLVNQVNNEREYLENKSSIENDAYEEELLKTVGDTMVGESIDGLIELSIPKLSIYLTAVKYAWSVMKIAGVSQALDAGDNVQIAMYSMFVQCMGYDALTKYLLKGELSDEDYDRAREALAVLLKSGYVSRSSALSYLDWSLSDSQYTACSAQIDSECDALLKLLAATDYFAEGFSLNGYASHIMLQNEYNKYLIVRLWGEDTYIDIVGTDEISNEDLPKYIVYSNAGEIIRYDIAEDAEYIVASSELVEGQRWEDEYSYGYTWNQIKEFTIDEDKVYYSVVVGGDPVDVDILYCANLYGDGSSEMLFDDGDDSWVSTDETVVQSSNLSAHDGSLVYLTGGDLVVAKPNGQKVTIMYNDGYVNGYVVSDNYIYFAEYLREDNYRGYSIKRSDLSGNVDVVIPEGSSSFIIDGTTLIYLTDYDESIWSYNTIVYYDMVNNDISHKYRLSQPVADVICSNDEYVIANLAYDSTTESYPNVIISSNGKISPLSIDNRYHIVSFDDKWIYWVNEKNVLYHSSFDGSNIECLNVTINKFYRYSNTLPYSESGVMSNEWIYFSNADDDGKLYRMRTDGNQVMKVADRSITGHFELIFDDTAVDKSTDTDMLNSNSQEIIDNLVSMGPWSASGALRQVGSYEIKVEFSENGNVEYSLYDTNQDRYLMDAYYGKYSVEQVDHASDDYVVLLELNETQSSSGITKPCTLSITYLYHVGNLGAHLSYEGCYNPDDISPGWPIEYYADIALSPHN